MIRVNWLKQSNKSYTPLEEHENSWKPKYVKALRNKRIFTAKENCEDVKYKARLAVNGSKFKFGTNYQKSFSPVMKT